MMRRRPLAMNRRGPGIVGTMARTAVIAGTATAVSRGVSGAMGGGQQAAQQQAAAQQAATADAAQQAQLEQMQAQMAAMQAQQAQAQMAAMQAQQAQMAAATMAAPAPGGDMMAELQQLVQLNQAGMLTDAEFAAAKAKLLGA